MKRSAMQPRRAPLAAVALVRGGVVIRRYSTLRPVSDRRRRQDRERAKAVKELRERGDCCARCGRPGGVGITDGHEKLARSQGGDPTRPDMLLCRAVCNTWAEDHPALAAWQGWKTSRKHPTAPCIADGRCPEGGHALGRYCGEERGSE